MPAGQFLLEMRVCSKLTGSQLKFLFAARPTSFVLAEMLGNCAVQPRCFTSHQTERRKAKNAEATERDPKIVGALRKGSVHPEQESLPSNGRVIIRTPGITTAETPSKLKQPHSSSSTGGIILQDLLAYRANNILWPPRCGPRHDGLYAAEQPRVYWLWIASSRSLVKLTRLDPYLVCTKI